MLLNLAKVIEDDYQIEFLFKTGGEIIEEFRKNYKTSIAIKPVKHSSSNIFKRFLHKLIKKIKKEKYFDIANLEWSKYDYVISNTITNGDLLVEVRKYYKGIIINYIHELQLSSSFYTNEASVKKMIDCSNAYFAPSNAVTGYLVNDLNILATKIKTLQYYIPSFSGDKLDQAPAQFTIGSVGTLDWRKSPDLFILIAKILLDKRPNANIKFSWKGSVGSKFEMDRLNSDIKKAGLTDIIKFIAASSDMNSFYSSINIFLLTSREDPYPLVVLEAASKSIPTICFDKAGGSPEFIECSKGGQVINYLDLNSAVEAILFYYDNPGQVRKDGKNAKLALVKTHQDKQYIKNQFKLALDTL